MRRPIDHHFNMFYFCFKQFIKKKKNYFLEIIIFEILDLQSIIKLCFMKVKIVIFDLDIWSDRDRYLGLWEKCDSHKYIGREIRREIANRISLYCACKRLQITFKKQLLCYY